jgi:hypothetical protein
VTPPSGEKTVVSKEIAERCEEVAVVRASSPFKTKSVWSRGGKPLGVVVTGLGTGEASCADGGLLARVR